MEPVFFESPGGPPIVLRSTPRLSSWNRVGDTGTARLTRTLGQSDAAIDPRLAECGGPVAVRFDVGLPRTTLLLEERDLDNYLLPLTAHLEERSAHPVVSVWGHKRYAEDTTLQIAAAVPRPAADVRLLRATASGPRDAFKGGFREVIHAAVAELEPLPDGPVALELAFVVGPDRSWLDLWWSTIDALGPILGQSDVAPEWHPRDSRVVDLGLHRTVDDSLGDEVLIGLRATVLPEDPEG